MQPCGILGADFNGINALASCVLTALQPCGTFGVGFDGINALASSVLSALQPCGTHGVGFNYINALASHVRRLKLVHTWTVGKCIVFTGIRLLLLICPFISSVFFLSNFQALKIFVALFSGSVRPVKLKLDTHADIGWMYHVYRNQAATSYLSLISLFFFLSSVQKLKVFSTLFSGTVRPRKFKLGTLVDNGWMYHVYQSQAAATYLSLYFSFSPIIKHLTFLVTLFSGTV